MNASVFDVLVKWEDGFSARVNVLAENEQYAAACVAELFGGKHGEVETTSVEHFVSVGRPVQVHLISSATLSTYLRQLEAHRAEGVAEAPAKQ